MGRTSIVALLALVAACGRVDFEASVNRDGAIAGDTRTTIDGPSTIDATHVPIRFVQSVGDNNATSSFGVTFTNDVQHGDTLIVAVDYDSNPPDIPRVSDSLGDVFTTVLAPVSIPQLMLQMYVVSARVSGAGGPDTVQVTFGESVGIELRLHEFSGLGSADMTGGATGFIDGTVDAPPAASVIGPPITTSTANEMVFGFELSSTAVSGPESMLALSLDDDITEFLIAPTPGVYQPTAVIQSGTGWAISGMTFRGE